MASEFNSDKVMLKVDNVSSEDERGIALPVKGREAVQERPG